MLYLAFYIAGCNALEGEWEWVSDECTWRRVSLPSRNLYTYVNKLFIVICVFYLRCPCSVVLDCLLVYPLLFILMLLLYFCLFVDHVNKSIIFVFGAFVYYFNNTISITILSIVLVKSFIWHCSCQQKLCQSGDQW